MAFLLLPVSRDMFRASATKLIFWKFASSLTCVMYVHRCPRLLLRDVLSAFFLLTLVIGSTPFEVQIYEEAPVLLGYGCVCTVVLSIRVFMPKHLVQSRTEAIFASITEFEYLVGYESTVDVFSVASSVAHRVYHPLTSVSDMILKFHEVSFSEARPRLAALHLQPTRAFTCGGRSQVIVETALEFWKATVAQQLRQSTANRHVITSHTASCNSEINFIISITFPAACTGDRSQHASWHVTDD